MKTCTYKINKNGFEKDFNSYAELLEYIVKNLNNSDYDSLNDVVFSKDTLRQSIVNEVKNISKEYPIRKKKLTWQQSAIDGSPLFGDDNLMNINEFIDSPACTVGGNPLITKLTKEDWEQHTISKLKEEEGYSLEDATAKAALMLEQSENIGDDAKALHSLVTHIAVSTPSESQSFLDTYNSVATPRFANDDVLINNFKQGLNYFYKKHIGEGQAVRNVNLITKIKGTNQPILGHIDYLFINPDGSAHIYKFVMSSQNRNEWSTVKEEKFKYNLVFLRQMLKAQGIKGLKNIQVHLVPVHMKYNEDYTRIDRLEVRDPISYDLDKRSNYVLGSYDNKVKVFIPDVHPAQEVTESSKDFIEEQYNILFPGINMKAEGISKSARSWIKDAPSTGDESDPLIIRRVNAIDHEWEVTISGEVYKITDRSEKNSNKEIRDLVEKHISELEDGKFIAIQNLKEAIRESYIRGFDTFQKRYALRQFGQNFLLQNLAHYLYPKVDKDGNKEYEWELIDDFEDLNVLAFRNNNTKQIDFLTLSSMDLYEQPKYKYDNVNNVLGFHYNNTQVKTLKGTYGHVETVRTMLALNEMLSKLDPNSYKLGQLKVISPVNGGEMYNHSFEFINKRYFNKILETINKNNPSKPVVNNFNNFNNMDKVEMIINVYNQMESSLSETELLKYKEAGFAALAEAKNNKESILLGILKWFQEEDGFNDAAQVEALSKDINASKSMRERANLYKLVSDAYTSLRNEYIQYEDALTWFDRNINTALTIPNANFQIVASNFIATINSIAEEVINKVQDFDHIFSDYYKAIGYGKGDNAILGHQTSTYSNFYKEDENDLIFKNPYDPNENLKPAERELLKQVLKIFHTTKTGVSMNEEETKAYIEKNPSYFEVPLQRAETASKLQNKEAFKEAGKRMLKIIKNPKKWYDEWVDDMSAQEKQMVQQDMEMYKLGNPYARQISKEVRKEMLKEHGKYYYETNVEHILKDMVASYVTTEKLNRFLVGTKAVLLQMQLLGTDSISKARIAQQQQLIKDYISLNVYKKSIMEPTEQQIMGFLSPIKRFVSYANIAGNVVGCLRDIENGYLEIFTRALNNFQTDLTMENIHKAYAYVVTNGPSNAMSINLLSKLCVRYRLSNTDLALITQRLKTGRSGILHFDNWAYATMRSPDFLNRMVLFVARCMQDGCFEAYSLGDDGELKYDWRKDERFKAFALDKKDDPDYLKQKSLYYSKIREYNQEHEDAPIDYTDDLPSAYSEREIMSIKNVANSAFGSYDNSLKSMGEFKMLGMTFGMYTTWMNGIWNNYFLKPGEYSINQLMEEQETDELGRPLFFTEDGGITTVDTGVKVLKHVPFLTQGIFYSMLELWDMTKEDGFKEAWKKANEDPVFRANKRKLFSDASIFLLFLGLFKLFLDGAYKDYKKLMPDNHPVANLLVELGYKSTSRMYDGSSGVLAIVDHLGNNMNPPMYQTPIKALKNVGNFVFTDQTFSETFAGAFSVTRSFRDTLKAMQA